MNKSIKYIQSDKIENNSFKEFESYIPDAKGFDVIVKVKATGLNPVDFKVTSAKELKEKQLGWDASGTVVMVGQDVVDFKVGDDVFYAGDITRPGSYSKFQTVDSRVISKKPKNLSFKDSAVFPLSSLTAYEGLFNSLMVERNNTYGKSILVLGEVSSVGEMVIQLAKKMTDLIIVSTSTSKEDSNYHKSIGSDFTIPLAENLKKELTQIGVNNVDYIFCLDEINDSFEQFSKIMNPMGRIVSCVELTKKVCLKDFFKKSISISYCNVFSKTTFRTSDMKYQGEILSAISKLIEEGRIKTPRKIDLGQMSIDSIIKGHSLLEHSQKHKLLLGEI